MPDRKEEIKKEFSALCVAAGEAQYHVAMRQKELGEINKKLEQLNVEYAEILRQESAPQPAPVAEEVK